jgi:hypothetical protein
MPRSAAIESSDVASKPRVPNDASAASTMRSLLDGVSTAPSTS